MKDLRLVATLLAEGASIDSIGGRLTAFNMLESVTAPSFPAMIPRLVVINIFEIENQHATYFERVTIRGSEDQTPIMNLVSEVNTMKPVFRSIHQVVPLILKTAGIYVVSVELGKTAEGPWEELETRKFFAHQAPQLGLEQPRESVEGA